MSELGNDPSARPPQASVPPPLRRPEIGVVFRPQSAPERLREVVESVEAAGVAELWLWEDCFAQGGLTSAAAALAWTRRLRVGVGLLPVPLRNPALAAMEIATLARLFPGRFVPGLGHGVLDWMGQVGSRVQSPMTLLREYTVAVRGLLHGDTVDVDGRYVHLDDVALDWPPRQVPPLLLGARGPRTLRLAGEVADGVILDSGVTSEMVRAARPEIDAGIVASGRTDPFRVVAFVEVGTSAEQVVDGAAAYGEAGADVVVFQASSEEPDAEPLIAVCAALGRG